MKRGRARDERLVEAGLILSSELSLPVTLQRIVELAAELTGARYGALGVLGRDGTITEFITTGVSDAERAAIGHIPVGRGILGVLIDDARPLRLAEIAGDPRSVGFPPNHPPMRSFLGAPVTARGQVFGNIYLTEKQDAAEFDADDQDTLVVLAAQAGVAIENARLYEEASDRARRLEALRAVAAAILRGDQGEAVLGLVARYARELAGAALATVAVPTDGGELAIEAADGAWAERLRGARFPVEGSVAGDVLRSGKVVVLPDAAADQRADQPLVGLGEVGPALFAPLSAEGRAFGTLAVANAHGGPAFREADVQLLEAFAAQAAVALEHVRLRRELERLLVVEDRERIAKELHDGAIQALFAVGMGLQGAATLARDPELAARIEGAVDELDRVIRDLRNYIFGLRPGILADRQLDQALRRLVEEFAERTGVVAVAEVDPEAAAALASSAGDMVQLAREALSNVSRHAAATTCRLSLRQEQDGVVLEVDDDGRGFDPDRVTGEGHGLPNLRQRAAALGGRAELSSVPGQGTTVRVTVPG
ncbi:MAG TPA: GAF domain-containing sensor histidine kinase [Actinomycetes bacterium]